MRKLNVKKTRIGIRFYRSDSISGMCFVNAHRRTGRNGCLFNTLLHGFDTSAIIRMDIPWWEALMGIVQIFILGWLTGALVAAIYNIGSDQSIE